MKKTGRTNRKSNRDVNIEKMYDSESKLFISTSQVTAVTEQDRVQNYENYINEKYLTGAIVRKPEKKNNKKLIKTDENV